MSSAEAIDFEVRQMKQSILYLFLLLIFVSCGENGGIAPGENEVLDAGSTDDGCEGVLVGGHCWYRGSTSESCDDVCTSHGGYSAATRTYAGDLGTNANCEQVLDALGVPASSFTTAPGCTFGCENDTLLSGRTRCTAPTSSSDTDPFVERMCACNE